METEINYNGCFGCRWFSGNNICNFEGDKQDCLSKGECSTYERADGNGMILNNVEEFIEKKATKFGTSAHIAVPKKYIGRKLTICVMKDDANCVVPVGGSE